MADKNQEMGLQNSDNSEKRSGLNRRRAIKNLLAGSTPILTGLPLFVKAWGQPATFNPLDNLTSTPANLSNINEGASNIDFMPTSAPTNAPTAAAPTSAPTNPTTNPAPTNAPTNAPTTNPAPTNAPTNAPTTCTFITKAPTMAPTGGPPAPAPSI